MLRFARSLAVLGLACAALACGAEEPPAQSAVAAPAESPATPTKAAAPTTPDRLPNGIVLALAQFKKVDGKSVPGAARMEFLYREGGEWRVSSWEDPDSNVFHKAMFYLGAMGPRILTLGGTQAIVKLWQRNGDALEGRELWRADFGGKWSRMRDAEVADLYGDGGASIAVATHDQGVVEVLHAKPDGSFEKVELDRQPNTFVHEIEIGDLDGDGVLEVYATPSEPNQLEGGVAQSGNVVRYVPAKKQGRTVVAALGNRHAKEILVDDVDGDGRDELYVSVEGVVGKDNRLEQPVEIRRYEADTPPDGGVVIATVPDRLCRFLTAGDVDGDGHKEMVLATYSSGLWILRPKGDPNAPWQSGMFDRDSAGFEHAAIFADLDGDGVDELYVASDKHKEVRRYVWDGSKLVREVIYKRPDDRPIFTWNIMPIPLPLIPGS
jgi:FG-GAP-like repeat